MWTFYLGVGVVSLAALGFVSNYGEGLTMLYRFHQLKEKNPWESVKKTATTIMRVAYLLAYQKLAKNVVHVGKNEYDVEYVLGNKRYKIRTRKRKGPAVQRVLLVIEENDKDVTGEIRPYLGPMEDWHGKIYSPFQLGYGSLTFHMADGSCHTVEGHRGIILGC
jgi:hypothetical protein